MIRPHVEYVDFVIKSGSKTLMSKLDRLQERRIDYCKNPKNRKSYSGIASLFKYKVIKLSQNLKGW